MGATEEKTQLNAEGSSVRKTILFILGGGGIGFLSASVLYSKNLPGWVPFGTNPGYFFGLFILICSGLGYVWAVTDGAEEAEKKRRSPLFNTLFTGAFIGFLIAAVLYSKFLPAWVPVGFAMFPTLFFTSFAVVGMIISFFWNRYSA